MNNYIVIVLGITTLTSNFMSGAASTELTYIMSLPQMMNSTAPRDMSSHAAASYLLRATSVDEQATAEKACAQKKTMALVRQTPRPTPVGENTCAGKVHAQLTQNTMSLVPQFLPLLTTSDMSFASITDTFAQGYTVEERIQLMAAVYQFLTSSRAFQLTIAKKIDASILDVAFCDGTLQPHADPQAQPKPGTRDTEMIDTHLIKLWDTLNHRARVTGTGAYVHSLVAIVRFRNKEGGIARQKYVSHHPITAWSKANCYWCKYNQSNGPIQSEFHTTVKNKHGELCAIASEIPAIPGLSHRSNAIQFTHR